MKTRRRFSKKSLELINEANSIVRKLKPVEKITLTQLYGLLVMKGVIVGSYKRLQHILAEANRWGLFNKGNLAGRYKGIDDEKLLTLRKLYL